MVRWKVQTVNESENRFPLSTLVIVAVFALLAGALGGALTGSITGRAQARNNPSYVQVVAGASPSAKQTSASPTAGKRGTATKSAGTPTQPVAIATTAPGAATDTNAVAVLAAKVNPAIVTVINKQVYQGYFNEGADLQPVGTGTGFIISQDGYIVTNNHVVENSQGLDVIFSDDTKVAATLIGTDPFTDLAVIKIDGAMPGVLELGDSTLLQPGDPVVAIGSALGSYTNTVTTGVISGTGRRIDKGDGSSYENMLQHDAPINPGNSGGPLLNMQGQVVGVNTYVVRWAEANFAADGLGFAIPTETVQQIVTKLIADGQIDRPFVGINSVTVTPSIADWYDLPVPNGAYVTEIASSSPAALAGMLRGDIITSVNGTSIDQGHSFVNLLFQYKPGDTVTLEAFRSDTNTTLSFEMTLGTRPNIP
jgi:S1-C subfamily serine protease